MNYTPITEENIEKVATLYITTTTNILAGAGLMKRHISESVRW